ncbi:lymphocyte antigen 96 [Polymixia lowei]
MFLKRMLLFAGVLLNSLSTFGKKTLACSSENLEIWYNYSGGLHYVSVSVTPCFYGMLKFNVTYTAIPLYEFKHIVYKASVWYNKKKWLERPMTDIYCSDMNLSHIVKGETLHDTTSFSLHPYSFPKGIYDIYVELIINTNMEENIQVNVTGVVK